MSFTYQQMEAASLHGTPFKKPQGPKKKQESWLGGSDGWIQISPDPGVAADNGAICELSLLLRNKFQLGLGSCVCMPVNMRFCGWACYVCM